MRSYSLTVVVAYLCTLLALCVYLSSCASSNPVASANDVAQRAYALYGTFVIIEEQAADIALNPATPAKLAQALRVADAKAKPTADTLVVLLKEYESANAALKAGTTTAYKVTIAVDNLTSWLTQAQTDVNALVNAVHAVPGH